MDSVVLLHLLQSIAHRFQWRLSALHVHHGLSPNADTWAEFCTELCTQYAIPLQVEHVNVAVLRGEHGLEAAARKLRHDAFLKQTCDFVALAHHADDQAETLLLQLLRGAGVKGAAAMPLLKSANPNRHATVRPLLDMSREWLQSYAVEHGLSWIEDESNADETYPRNFLRHQILLKLAVRFPQYRETLARSARHFSEAAELAHELAQLDAVHAFDGETLGIEPLHRLSHTRAKNLLRYFLHARGASLPQSVQLEEMLGQLRAARDDAAVCVAFGDWEVRRYQGRIYVMKALADFDPSYVVSWLGEQQLEWPALSGQVSFGKALGTGINLAKLQERQITLRLRSGGESLRLHHKGVNRSLKNLLQEGRVPPWRRQRLPLLYCGEDLVAIVGVAIHAEYLAQKGEASLLVSCEK